jgi:glycosyltransferase involved in cell wall biosynthesis
MKKYYSKLINPDKIKVIYNGRSFVGIGEELQKDIVAKIDKLKKEFIVLGVIAQLTKRKGVDQAIRVLPQLPGYCLLVIGDGKEKKNLEKLAKKHNVENRCIFLGYHNNGSRFLPFIDIYLMLSRSEGFPLSLVEAAARGIPTVCSGIPLFKEVFIHNEVEIFELEDENSLLQAIKKAKQSEDILSRIIKEFYDKNLTAEKMGSNYILAYKKLVCI